MYQIVEKETVFVGTGGPHGKRMADDKLYSYDNGQENMNTMKAGGAKVNNGKWKLVEDDYGTGRFRHEENKDNAVRTTVKRSE
jgi:hypothetical protein